MKAKKYMVEHEFAYGWDDAGWTDSLPNGEVKPTRFNSIAMAGLEIEEHCAISQEAFMAGELEEAYTKKQYRVVEA
jgi:hypothetical protein